MKFVDEIVEEVRAAREAYAAQFDYDLRRIFEDLEEKEKRLRQEPPTRRDLSAGALCGTEGQHCPRSSI